MHLDVICMEISETERLILIIHRLTIFCNYQSCQEKISL